MMATTSMARSLRCRVAGESSSSCHLITLPVNIFGLKRDFKAEKFMENHFLIQLILNFVVFCQR
jgi:hypothetical protein